MLTRSASDTAGGNEASNFEITQKQPFNLVKVYGIDFHMSSRGIWETRRLLKFTLWNFTFVYREISRIFPDILVSAREDHVRGRTGAQSDSTGLHRLTLPPAPTDGSLKRKQVSFAMIVNDSKLSPSV